MADQSPNVSKEPDDDFFDTFFDDGVVETIGEVLGQRSSGNSHDESSCEAPILISKESSLNVTGNNLVHSLQKSIESHPANQVIVLKPAHLKDPFEGGFKKQKVLPEDSRHQLPDDRSTGISSQTVESPAPTLNPQSDKAGKKEDSVSLNELLTKVQTFLKETPASTTKRRNSESENSLTSVPTNSAEVKDKPVVCKISETNNKQISQKRIEENKSEIVSKTESGSVIPQEEINTAIPNRVDSPSNISSPVILTSDESLDAATKEAASKKDEEERRDLNLDDHCMDNGSHQLTPEKRNKININLKSQLLACTSILNSGSSSLLEPHSSSLSGSCSVDIPPKSRKSPGLYSDLSSDDSSAANRVSKKKKKKRERDNRQNSRSVDRERSDENYEKHHKYKRKGSPEYRKNRDYKKSSKRRRSRSSSLSRKKRSRKDYKRDISPQPDTRHKRRRSPYSVSSRPVWHRSRSRSNSPAYYRMRKSPSPRNSRRRSRSRSPFINEIRRLEKQWELVDRAKKQSSSEQGGEGIVSNGPTWSENFADSTTIVSKTVVQMQSTSFTFGPPSHGGHPGYPGGSLPQPPANYGVFSQQNAYAFGAHQVPYQPAVPGSVPHQPITCGMTQHPLTGPPQIAQMVPPPALQMVPPVPQMVPPVPQMVPPPALQMVPPVPQMVPPVPQMVPPVPQMVPPPGLSQITPSNEPQSALRRQLDILKTVLPPPLCVPPGPSATPPILPAPSIMPLPKNDSCASNNLGCQSVPVGVSTLLPIAPQMVPSPVPEMVPAPAPQMGPVPAPQVGLVPAPQSVKSPNKSKKKTLAKEKTLQQKRNFENCSNLISIQSTSTSKATESVNENTPSEPHPLTSTPEITVVPQTTKNTAKESDADIGVVMEDYDSDVIVEDPPPKPPIELICLSEDEGVANVPEECHKEVNKNCEGDKILPINQGSINVLEPTAGTSTSSAEPTQETPSAAGTPPIESCSAQLPKQTTNEIIMAEQPSQPLLLEAEAPPHLGRRRKRWRKRERRLEKENLKASNTPPVSTVVSQEQNKNHQSHKSQPISKESVKETSAGKSKLVSPEPTPQETCVLILTPSTEASLNSSSTQISKEIFEAEQSSPPLLSKNSPSAVTGQKVSPIEEDESPKNKHEQTPREQKRKTKGDERREERKRRRRGKENQSEKSPKFNEDERPDSVLRECRDMIDSLRIGRFAVKDTDSDDAKEAAISSKGTGTNSPLVQNLVHFSYTRNLEPNSVPKVKDVSTNTTFRLCLDVSTNTDADLPSSKDCMLQTDLECLDCLKREDLIKDMHTELLKLKKERDELLAMVGSFQSIPGLDLTSANQETLGKNCQHISASGLISSKSNVENGVEFSTDKTCSFSQIPPPEPISYDYNHSSPSRSSVQSKSDSYLGPRKPFQ